MRLREPVLLFAALVPLAGCLPAPPPAESSPGIAAAEPASPVERVQRLANYPDETTKSALTTIIRDGEDPALRQEALYVMADVGGEADAATIAEALRDPDDGVRMAAIDVLSTMEGETPAAMLIAALSDQDPKVRLRAVDALGDIPGPTASMALQQALGDPDAAVREAAGELLEEPGRLRPD